MKAAELLKASHPLNKPFTKWLKGKEATKRQARKYLATYPQLRQPAITELEAMDVIKKATH